MDAVHQASDPVLFAIVLVAVILDFKYMKISNRLILVGLVLALAFGLLGRGVPDVVFVLWNISFPVIALYLFYLIGALGAGDIKLFSVIGGFLNFKELVVCMLFSFLAGAVLSLGKLLYLGRFWDGIRRGGGHLWDVLRGGPARYERDVNGKTDVIHFSFAILLGLLFTKFFVLWHI